MRQRRNANQPSTTRPIPNPLCSFAWWGRRSWNILKTKFSVQNNFLFKNTGKFERWTYSYCSGCCHMTYNCIRVGTVEIAAVIWAQDGCRRGFGDAGHCEKRHINVSNRNMKPKEAHLLKTCLHAPPSSSSWATVFGWYWRARTLQRNWCSPRIVRGQARLNNV